MNTYQLYFYKHKDNLGHSSCGSFFIVFNGMRATYTSDITRIRAKDFRIPLNVDTFAFTASSAVLLGDFTLPTNASNDDLQQTLREHFLHLYI